MITFRANGGRMGARTKPRSPATHEVTRLLQAWSSGDEGALKRLTPLVYDQLHRLAHRYMSREHPGQTLQTTALVHEVYPQAGGREERRLAKSRSFLWTLRPPDAPHPD